MRTILTCGCGDTDKFARDAFKILFPDYIVPQIVHTMTESKNPHLNQIVYGIKKSDAKFAYFIEYDDASVEAWDLLKGVRVL